jgi:hypothetical protein
MSDTENEDIADAVVDPPDASPKALNVIWEDDKIQKVSGNHSLLILPRLLSISLIVLSVYGQ